jgi:hypothetical protein
VLSRLSSQVGDRTEESNRAAVQQALEELSLLTEIVEGLRADDPASVGGCAELLTRVAEHRPGLVAPLIEQLAPLLSAAAPRFASLSSAPCRVDP